MHVNAQKPLYLLLSPFIDRVKELANKKGINYTNYHETDHY